MQDIEQIRSTIRLWLLLDMMHLEVSRFVGIQDKYIENKRKGVEKEIKAVLHYITKKYRLDSKKPLEDFVDELYDIFELQCNFNQEKLAQIKPIIKAELEHWQAQRSASSNPVQSS